MIAQMGKHLSMIPGGRSQKMRTNPLEPISLCRHPDRGQMVEYTRVISPINPTE